MTFFETCRQSEATSLALLSAVAVTHTPARPSRIHPPICPEGQPDVRALRPPARPVRVYGRTLHG